MNERDAVQLWECVFLTRAEIDDLLQYVKSAALHRFIYPMFVFAAHTGARRSEIARAELTDLEDGFVMLHERKRSRESKTTRRVPLSGLLKNVMGEWIKDHSGGPLFYDDGEPFSRKSLAHHFKHTLKDSKWKALRGWHTFRHSYISCLATKGIDQRVIDELVGHCTEEQRRRYRHLLPSKITKCVVSVFG